MIHPLMLDLIAKERRKIRQEIAEEYSQEELEALAKRSRMPVEEFLECEVEGRMRDRLPGYNPQLGRIGARRYRR